MKKTEWNVSVCGLNCAVCDMHLAGHGDERIRREIIDWFKEKRGRDLKPEQVRCEGCRGSVETHWSCDCRMLECAKKRGLNYCFECTDFPCVILNEFASDGAEHHKRTVENLKRMKKIGFASWIAEQMKRGPPTFCP